MSPDASHFTAIATYTATPETADRVADLLPELARASRREPGNISYTVARHLEEPTVFTIVEIYEDADAFTAHRESVHFAEIGKAQILPLLESRVVVGYEGDGIIR